MSKRETHKCGTDPLDDDQRAAPAERSVGAARTAGPRIRLGAAVGRGRSALSAFDDALVLLGVGDVNLVRLSSVIPPDAALEIVAHGSVAPAGAEWGDRLYCVYAAETADVPGQMAWAGIGWTRVTGGDGRGLFVEHEAPDEATLDRYISGSLDDMITRRPQTFDEPRSVRIGATCEDPGTAVCALVLAAYESEGWRGVTLST